MIKISLIALLFILRFAPHVKASDALADLKIPTAETYEAGRFLCTDKYLNLVQHEKGFYVLVPLNYRHPEKGSTEVYAFFANGGFDPKKQTLLYFTGGPGQTGHWGLFPQAMEFNVLIMDQRGIGCSRPPLLKDYLSPDFYSSENVARDAEEIRKSLKLESLSLFGISYGTIPATIYASLFPKSTRSLILEGTVFSASDLYEAPHRRKLLQKMLNELPSEIKLKMETVSRDFGIPNVWLSNLGRDSLLLPFGLDELKAKLLNLNDEEKFQNLIKMLKDYYTPSTVESHVLFVSNHLPYLMITCQEMGLSIPGVGIEDSLIDGKLVPKAEESSQKACARLGASTGKLYSALNYPVKVPVTYFQGADDSATAAPQGIHHYKSVPQGSKQLLILRKGGHNPNLGLIREENQLQIEMFNLAVRGERIPKALVQKFNSSQSEYFWAFTFE